MKTSSPIPYKENRDHGTSSFPCAFYQVDSRCYREGAPFEVKHHWHEELEILYFKRGRFHVEINAEKYDFSQECFCFVNSEELHYIYTQEDFAENAVVFSPRMLMFASDDEPQSLFLTPLAEHQLSLPRFITPEHSCFSFLKNTYGLMEKIFASKSPILSPDLQLSTGVPAEQLQIKAALLQILAALASSGAFLPASPHMDRRIEIVKVTISYMKAHYAENIYNSDLAALVNLNEQYFCRFFKKIIGKPPITYLNEIRMKHAAQMLLESSDSVTDICLECGFNNLGNFMRIFKNTYGLTPLQYRKTERTSSLYKPS